MPIGYSPWTDAAAYGQQFGNQMAQAIIGIPAQRRQEGFQQQHLDLQRQGLNQRDAAMEQALMMREKLLELQREKMGQVDAYRNEALEARKALWQSQQEAAANRLQYLQDKLEWQRQLPINMGGNGIYVPGQGQQQDPALTPFVPNQSLGSGVQLGSQQSLNQPPPAPVAAVVPQSPGGIPLGGGHLVQPPARPMAINPNAAFRNDLTAIGLEAGLINSTNPVIQALTNKLYQASQSRRGTNQLSGQLPATSQKPIIKWEELQQKYNLQ
jgi:hypothetical protein